MKKILNWFINLYAVWVILSFVIGYFWPKSFLWCAKGSFSTYAMAVVMLSMGLSLKISDFEFIFKQPKTIVLAAISQFTVMPLSGFCLAILLGLPKEFAVGLIIVACCPGGTASYMIAYIGRANLALSVISTAMSTFLGIILTPLLTKLLAGQMVPVDAWGMFLNVVKVVLLPVTLGAFINWKFPEFVKRLGQTGPVLSTIAIVFISGGIIAPAVVSGKAELLQMAGKLLLAATLLHGLGFGLGYGLARIFKYNVPIAKAVACETGMQNGGLAAVLAKNNFPAFMPMISVPAVFCSVMQTVVGGILATIWRFTSRTDHE